MGVMGGSFMGVMGVSGFSILETLGGSGSFSKTTKDYQILSVMVISATVTRLVV